LKSSCTADALSSTQTCATQPRTRTVVCICSCPSTKALERIASLSWTSEDCVQRCYRHHSKFLRLFERVMTTHVAFNRSCSFLRILPSDKIIARSLGVFVSIFTSRFFPSPLVFDFSSHNLEISLDRWLFPSHRFADSQGLFSRYYSINT
jgi:hypothetical protein